MATRARRIEEMYSPGSATHLLFVYLDDPPPLKFSDAWYAQYNPTSPATVENQRLYPHTPFIDYLAANGMKYANAWTSCVCSPGRASFMTGEYQAVDATPAAETGTGLGTVIRDTFDGDLVEFRDSGFDNGTPISTVLGAVGSTPFCRKAFIGKLHLSQDNIGQTGLEYTIMDTGGAGRLGTWDKRFFLVNNHNQPPFPAENAEGPQDADTNETGSSGGSYYFYRVSDNGQERNIGTIADTNTNNSDSKGEYSTTRFINEAIEFFTDDVQDGERGFCTLWLTACHSPFDEPPPNLISTERYRTTTLTSWSRQNAMVEAVDKELYRFWTTIPAKIRNNLTIIFASDNGIDGTYLDDAIDTTKEGLSLGSHLETIRTDNAHKQSIYRFGVQSQMFCFGPTVDAGTTNALIDFPVDTHQTVARYFGRQGSVGAAAQGTHYINTWTAGVDADTHTGVQAITGYWFPNGSPDGTVQTDLAPKTNWTATSFIEGNIVTHTPTDEPREYASNWICGTGGATAGQEPGITSSTTWTELAYRYVGITYWVKSGDVATNAALGLFKLVRPLWTAAGAKGDVDELYHLFDETWDGTNASTAAVNQYEDDTLALDITSTGASGYNQIYALLDAALNTAMGGYD